MKYKVGDKIRIKTWEELEEEYGLNKNKNINLRIGNIQFVREKEKYLNKNFPNRIVEVTKVKERVFCYASKDCSFWEWTDEMIEGLADELKERERIKSRFDILDIR